MQDLLHHKGGNISLLHQALLDIYATHKQAKVLVIVQNGPLSQEVSRIIAKTELEGLEVSVLEMCSKKLALIDGKGKVVFSSATSLLTVENHSLSTLQHLQASPENVLDSLRLQGREYLIFLKLDHLVFSLDYLASLGTIYQKQQQALFLYDTFYKPGFSILSLEALVKLSSKLSFVEIINNSIQSREVAFQTFDHASQKFCP